MMHFLRTRRVHFIFTAVLTFAFLAPAAFGHVQLVPERLEGGQYAKLQFRVIHGCDAAPTTGVTVRLPEGFVLARPMMKPGWEISTVTEPYPEPVPVGERTFTEGFMEMTWRGGLVPAEYMEEFEVAVIIPQGAGEVHRMFVVQECEGVEEPLEFGPELTVVGPPGGVAGGGLGLPVILAGVALLVALGAVALAFTRRS